MPQTKEKMQEWLGGRISLGAAANWDKNEIRIISEIGFNLAQQGRIEESITLFEGLVAVAPATVYFHNALGALFLKNKKYPEAIQHLTDVLKIDPNNIAALVNIGEAHLSITQTQIGLNFLEKAMDTASRTSLKQNDQKNDIDLAIKRANALLKSHKR